MMLDHGLEAGIGQLIHRDVNGVGFGSELPSEVVPGCGWPRVQR
jgi:hypothetical protein